MNITKNRVKKKYSLFRFNPIRVGIVALLTVVVCKLIFIPFRTNGVSMEPTYLDNQYCFANRLSYLLKEPKRGDIVVIRSNEKPKSRYLLKRIVALPNETIEIRNGLVNINGEYYEEKYIRNRMKWNMDEMKLDENHYYVIGDNRSMSMEEHVHMRVHRKNIIGKIFP